MATDDERRRVAERIRMADERDAAGFDCLIANAVRGYYFCKTPCEDCHRRLLAELADLIEPTCDRATLLALAGEMDHPIRQAVWNQTAGVRREHIMSEYARRIREACEVVE